MINNLPKNAWAQEIVEKQIKDVSENPAILFQATEQGSLFPSLVLFNNYGTANDETLNMTSQITTHFVEDNSARQDHWALPPITYTLSGLIGEVIYKPPKKVSNVIERITDYLQPLQSLAPTFGSYTQSAINIGQQLDVSYRRYKEIAQQAITNITGIGEQIYSNQENVARKLKSLRTSRTLVSIATPYGILENYAISSIILRQGDTKFQSTLEVTLQEWREVMNETRTATPDELSLLARAQKAGEENNGVAKGNEVPTSILYDMFGKK